jgi:hypothetical protein
MTRLLMTDFHQLLVQPMAMQESESSAHSRLDSKGFDQNAIDRYMHLASRIVVVPWRWTGTHVGLFAVAVTEKQVSNLRIAIYIVKDGKTIPPQLTPDERREFHDLMELDMNRSPAFTVEA